ncbi:MAG: 16S rRNA (cytosine(1402)-N(4))-methyltransferase RsmH, partial [Oscillospiraceae bacterium]
RLAGQRAKVVQTNFRYASSALSEYGVTEIDGALLDLGVSSYQLDEESRGFSYKGSAPLDMRMSQSGISAADIVNSYTREELAKILKEYGEEPYAWYIAGKIVAMREINPLTTTDELVRAIVSALPASVRRKDKNPARRSFQALRIAVNGEMDALSEGLDDLFSMLKPGGRLAIITFHSLEDRIVKQRFKAWATACTCPPEFPVCVCGGKAKAKLITKKPIEADTLEQEDNRRARSAKLRVAEKL